MKNPYLPMCVRSNHKTLKMIDDLAICDLSGFVCRLVHTVIKTVSCTVDDLRLRFTAMFGCDSNPSWEYIILMSKLYN